jgi:hypothetical protein
MWRPVLGIRVIADVVIFDYLVIGGRLLWQGLDELVDRLEADDGRRVDGLEAGVLEFGCDETE